MRRGGRHGGLDALNSYGCARRWYSFLLAFDTGKSARCCNYVARSFTEATFMRFVFRCLAACRLRGTDAIGAAGAAVAAAAATTTSTRAAWVESLPIRTCRATADLQLHCKLS